MFFGSTGGKEAGTIDVMVRTSSAAIFGYFVSANFGQRGKRLEPDFPAPTSVKAIPSESPKGQIGFSAEPSSLEPVRGYAEGRCWTSYQKQEIIVAAIGAAALIILLLFRNFGPDSSSASGAVSQMRDFVSGCIGFLISCVSRQNALSDDVKS